jgi:hypothetical protein
MRTKRGTKTRRTTKRRARSKKKKKKKRKRKRMMRRRTNTPVPAAARNASPVAAKNGRLNSRPASAWAVPSNASPLAGKTRRRNGHLNWHHARARTQTVRAGGGPRWDSAEAAKLRHREECDDCPNPGAAAEWWENPRMADSVEAKRAGSSAWGWSTVNDGARNPCLPVARWPEWREAGNCRRSGEAGGMPVDGQTHHRHRRAAAANSVRNGRLSEGGVSATERGADRDAFPGVHARRWAGTGKRPATASKDRSSSFRSSSRRTATGRTTTDYRMTSNTGPPTRRPPRAGTYRVRSSARRRR